VYNPTISKKEKRKIIKWAKETTIMEKQLKKNTHTHWRESNELLKTKRYLMQHNNNNFELQQRN
jgi:hypothetical protein